MLTRRAIDEYTRGVNAASRSAIDVLLSQLESLDWDAPVAELRDAIVALMQTCCESAATNAATVAAEFYDAARESELGRSLGAVPEGRYDPRATEGAVRAFMQGLVDGKGSRSVIRRCRERVDYEAKKAAANSIKANARRDRAKPRYARVPSGSETCEFCLMLASRGPVYRSADSAGEGNHWHANCDCRIVPVWDSHREGKNVSVLGLRKDDNLILDAMYNDPARMRNRLCADLWNRVDSLPYEVAEGHSRLNATEGRFVEVFVDGCYNGLYCLTDKINRKKLDLVKVETDESGKLTHHGVLYKSYDWTDETRFQNVNMSAGIENTLVWRGWEQKYPDDSAAESCWKPLRDLISFTAKKTNPNSYNFAAYLRAKYYLQNIVDYALFVNVLNLGDNVCKNLFVSFRDVDTTSPKALLTPWDLDCSLGRSWDGSKAEDVGFTDHMLAADIIGRPILTGPYYYRTRIRDTWERWKKGPFSVDSVSARIKAYNNLFETSGARTRESARWPSSVAARITEQSYMIDWYKRSVAAADKFFEGFPSGIEEVRDAVTFVISSAGGHISVGGSGTARLSLCTGDGILLTDGDISLPYTTATLSRGLYIVTVRRGQTVTRRKVLVR